MGAIAAGGPAIPGGELALVLQRLVQAVGLGGEGRLDSPRRQIVGRDTEPQEGPGHRPGRRSHDHRGIARVPAEVVGQRDEHPGLVGLADHPARAENQTHPGRGRGGSAAGRAG